MIVNFRAFKKVRLHEARHLVEVTVAGQPDLLEGSFGALGHSETVHCDKHSGSLCAIRIETNRYRSDELSSADEPLCFSVRY